MLEELGIPFQLDLVKRDEGALTSPEYLAMNPNGLIPVLVDGDTVLYETAAILLHLADTHPASKLAPRMASAERAQFYKWLIWLTNTLQPALIAYFYPHRWVAEGNVEGPDAVPLDTRLRPPCPQPAAHQRLPATHAGPSGRAACHHHRGAAPADRLTGRQRLIGSQSQAVGLSGCRAQPFRIATNTSTRLSRSRSFQGFLKMP